MTLLRDEAKIQQIAREASEAFFAKVAELLPPNTPGDFPPDATIAWELAAESAVRTLVSNIEDGLPE